jgi:hypothetical protein
MSDIKLLYNKRAAKCTPIFPGAPGFVYGQNPGSVNSDPANHSAGGYVRPEDIRSNLVKKALKP